MFAFLQFVGLCVLMLTRPVRGLRLLWWIERHERRRERREAVAHRAA